MRDPRQEARRIPHAFQDTSDGKKRVILYLADGTEVPCDPADTYGDAVQIAERTIKARFPGHHL